MRGAPLVADNVWIWDFCHIGLGDINAIHWLFPLPLDYGPNNFISCEPPIQKQKQINIPNKQQSSLILTNQGDMALGLGCFASEEFGNKH